MDRCRCDWTRLGRYRLALLLPALLVTSCASTTTVVHLESTPPGAQVHESGHGHLGTTDTQVELETQKRAQRDFVFRLDGYEELRLTRAVVGKEMTLHAHLVPLAATRIHVRTEPSSATVRVFHEGREVDWSGHAGDAALVPLESEALWRGGRHATFVVVAAAPGYATKEVKRTLERGRNYDLSVVLKQADAELRINSAPTGADVYERALGYLGRTPLTLSLDATRLERVSNRRDHRGMDTATLHFRVEMQGYRKNELSHPVSLGDEPNVLHFELEKQ